MPIYLRITVDGIAKEISTGRQCLPARWNSRAGRMMGTKEDARQLNSYLDTLQTKVYEVRRQLLEKISKRRFDQGLWKRIFTTQQFVTGTCFPKILYFFKFTFIHTDMNPFGSDIFSHHFSFSRSYKIG